MYQQYGSLGLGIDVSYTTASGASKIGHPVADASGTCSDPFAVQQMLKDLGYYSDKIDGVFGTNTFTGLSAFAMSQGIAYTSKYPTASLCQALMDSWQAARAMPAPAAAPAPTPTPTTPMIAPWMLRLAPAIQAAMVRPGAPRTAAMAPSAQAPTGLKAWWSKASTGEKALVLGGGVLVVGTVVYFVMAPKRAVANRRRRRSRARSIGIGA